MPTNALIRALTPRTLARRFFRPQPGPAPPLTDPLHSDVPALRQAEIAAIYYGNRMAGDFYEFLRVGPDRVIFGLFDIAGRREDTRDILIAAQNTFRTLAPTLFAGESFNEPAAMIELSQQLNRTILRIAGVRSCPAFIGCYHEDLGTVVTPMLDTRPRSSAIAPASRSLQPPAFRWDSSRTQPAVLPLVRWCRARLFWSSPAELWRRRSRKKSLDWRA